MRPDRTPPRHQARRVEPLGGTTAAFLALVELGRPAWHTRAACRGLMAPGRAMFFPGRGEPTDHARSVCATCPVTGPCGQAGADEKFGVWAGTSERQRRAERAARHAQRAST